MQPRTVAASAVAGGNVLAKTIRFSAYSDYNKEAPQHARSILKTNGDPRHDTRERKHEQFADVCQPGQQRV